MFYCAYVTVPVRIREHSARSRAAVFRRASLYWYNEISSVAHLIGKLNSMSVVFRDLQLVETRHGFHFFFALSTR